MQSYDQQRRGAAPYFPLPDESGEVREPHILIESRNAKESDYDAPTLEVKAVRPDDEVETEHDLHAITALGETRPSSRGRSPATIGSVPVWHLQNTQAARKESRFARLMKFGRDTWLFWGALAAAGVGIVEVATHMGDIASFGQTSPIAISGPAASYPTGTTIPDPTKTPRPQPTATATPNAHSKPPAPTVPPKPPKPTATPNKGPYAVLAAADIPDDNIHTGDTVFAECTTSSSVKLADGHVEPIQDFVDDHNLKAVPAC